MELLEGLGESETFETFGNKEGTSFPSSHLEGMDISSLEKLSATDAAVEVGKSCYEGFAKDLPGVLAGFREAGGRSQEDFSRTYADYITDPEKMRTERPVMYKFMRDEVFFGREYTPIADTDLRAESDHDAMREASEPDQEKYRDAERGRNLAFTGSSYPGVSFISPLEHYENLSTEKRKEFEVAGGQSPEDFARIYVDYMYKPLELRTKRPAIYEFIKSNFFGGREFPVSEKYQAQAVSKEKGKEGAQITEKNLLDLLDEAGAPTAEKTKNQGSTISFTGICANWCRKNPDVSENDHGSHAHW